MQTVNLSPGMENREFNSEGYLETHFDTRGDPYMAMIAESDNLLNIYYHLRYEVFCEERGFIAPRADLLDKVESDNHAIHLLLYHQELDLFVGGVRMILPQTEYPFNALPAIELDDSPFHQQFIDHTLPFPDQTTMEISRLLISKKRMGIIRNHLDKQPLNQTAPSLAYLFKKIYQISKQQHLTHFLSIQAPALIYLMQTLYVPVIKIGQPVHYVGKLRQPCYNSFEDIVKYAKAHHQKFYNFYVGE